MLCLKPCFTIFVEAQNGQTFGLSGWITSPLATALLRLREISTAQTCLHLTRLWTKSGQEHCQSFSLPLMSYQLSLDCDRTWYLLELIRETWPALFAISSPRSSRKPSPNWLRCSSIFSSSYKICCQAHLRPYRESFNW